MAGKRKLSTFPSQWQFASSMETSGLQETPEWFLSHHHGKLVCLLFFSPIDIAPFVLPGHLVMSCLFITWIVSVSVSICFEGSKHFLKSLCEPNQQMGSTQAISTGCFHFVSFCKGGDSGRTTKLFKPSMTSLSPTSPAWVEFLV